jgi:hypothetical protein
MPDDVDLAHRCADKAAKTFFRDILDPSLTIDKTVIPVLKLIKSVLQLTDKTVYDLLGGAEFNNEGYIFCSSWIMTWFSHDVKRWANVQRLWDLFMSRRPFFVIYFCAAFISLNKGAIEEGLE